MALQKGSEFTAVFSHFIQRLHQGGQIDSTIRKYLPTVQEQCGNIATVIGYQNTVSAFILLGLGALFAGLFLAGEMMCVKVKNNMTSAAEEEDLKRTKRISRGKEGYRGWEEQFGQQEYTK